MNSCLDLFLSFAKIGLFTFGGGYAMIAVIEDVCVTKKQWISHDEMMDITVIAESTPGPIAINCATYVGYKKNGFIGSLCATLGIVFPSFVVICLIALFLDRFLEIEIIANAFEGIRVAVGILVFDAGFKMYKKMKEKPMARRILMISFCAMLVILFLSLPVSSIMVMFVMGLWGLIQEVRHAS